MASKHRARDARRSSWCRVATSYRSALNIFRVPKDPNYIFVSGVSYFKNSRVVWGRYLVKGCTPPPLEVLEIFWNQDSVVDLVTRLEPERRRIGARLLA